MRRNDQVLFTHVTDTSPTIAAGMDLLNGLYGGRTIPGGFLVDGDTIQFICGGNLQCSSSSNQITLELSLGGVTFNSSSFPLNTTAETSFSIDCVITKLSSGVYCTLVKLFKPLGGVDTFSTKITSVPDYAAMNLEIIATPATPALWSTVKLRTAKAIISQF